MPDGEDILAEVEKRFRPNETMILTKPMDHDGSYSGKAEWVTKNMPDFRRRLVPTHITKSEFVKDFNSLLIDDSQENVENYIKAGGAAILVPRPYNQNEAVFNKGPEEVVAYVASRMDKWIDIVDHPAKNRKGNTECQ
jgi:5'(3')-deoxyribonucleotidase